MHHLRPTVPSRPCAACGTAVDPLRAGTVLLFDDGFRFLCDEDCTDRFRDGERSDVRGAPASLYGTPSAPVSAPPQLERRPRPRRPVPVGTPRIRWAALSAAGIGAMLGVLPGPAVVGALSATATATAAILALFLMNRREVGTLVWSAGPAGVILAALAGFLARVEDPPALATLVGAAVAAAAVVGRAWLDEVARHPVDDAVAAAEGPAPTRLRIPVEDTRNPMRMASAEVDATTVRTGDDVIVLDGEIVPVDGVIKAGEATAILHPGARTPVRRVPGDPLLAGARILEGAVRIVTTRIGDDRALVRALRFGNSNPWNDASPVTRLTEQVVRWGGLTALLAAAGALFLSEGSGLAASLGASAAVLLGTPLLAARRAASQPLVAAAAAAGQRGIVYQNARTLDQAGRVTVVALCTHGIVTEGEPEVVQIHPVDGSNPDHLLALAAPAETAAENHPIANAILRMAEARGIVPESVRRATYLPGRGVTALAPGGEPLVIGNRQLLLDEGVSVAVADSEAAHAERIGHTALFMAIGGRVRAILSLRDEVRPGARAAVQRIFDQHAEVVLLSGDHRTTVESLAKNLDVTHVKAELLPEDRGAEVRRLGDTGGTVATVGRPVQDDNALAAAHVPVVLGAAGGPAGERGVALASEDVRDATAALWIARAARDEAWRATLSTLATGTVLILCATLGLITPVVAALGALGVDLYALPAGARLLRRIERRVPTRM